MFHSKSPPPRIAAAASLAFVAAFFLFRRRDSKEPVSQLPPLQHHPSTMRNRIPILKALLSLLPSPDTFSGPALEIATGTGALMEVVAPAFPHLTMQPSEYVPSSPPSPDSQWILYGKIGLRLGLDELSCIDQRGRSVFPNCLPAVALDLSVSPWPDEVTGKNGTHALILCANTLHVTPWACSVGLLRGAGLALRPGGHLVVYGPFKVLGEFVGADGGKGNRTFDAKLRSTNKDWGIRDVGELEKVAEGFGLALSQKVEMPANNLCLHFTKAS